MRMKIDSPSRRELLALLKKEKPQKVRFGNGWILFFKNSTWELKPKAARHSKILSCS